MSSNIQARITTALAKTKKTGLSGKDLLKKTGVRRKDKEQFRQALDELMAENRVLERKGKYLLVKNLGLTPGKIVKVNGTFGFASPLKEGERDFFIPGHSLMGAMPGDLVLLKVERGTGELPEGKVWAITQDGDGTFSGVLARQEDKWLVVPDRYVKFPMKVDTRSIGDAREGDKVVARILKRGDRHSAHVAEITGSFGDSGRAQSCCGAVLMAAGIREKFPDEVLEQAQAIAAGAGIHPKEIAARTDLRDQVLFTIDGADAKDLDDAVSLKRLEDGWELGVHIADVSYYVTHQSPLDTEAMARGTSVYYADKVIPMLPAELSNGICSLNPDEDRLAFSAFCRLDGKGKLKDYRFVKSVIRSRVKGVYTEVNALLDGSATAAVKKKYKGLEETLQDMEALAALLRNNRYGRGGMDLDSVESKVLVGEDGSAIGIEPRQRGESERIVEEFMLTANEAAASFALERSLPFVYRVHEDPSPDKVGQLFQVLDSLGISHRNGKAGASSKDLSAILDKVRDTDLAPIINTMVLRTMAKAKYSAQNTGHFGLALKKYAHFTSPIRRYPDLVVHRVLSGLVTGMRPDNIEKRFCGFVTPAALQSTEREIAAMTAERDCEDCYKAEYMGKHIGETFGGVITSATSFGVYVQLPNTAEGLVLLRDFPAGDWVYEAPIAFVDGITGKRLRLGDSVEVIVAGTDVSAGQIDLVFPDSPAHIS